MNTKIQSMAATAEAPVFIKCPDCGQESFAWNVEKGKWLCLSCGTEHYDQHIAFCECCGEPNIVVDARVYESTEPDDYNPFVCPDCQEFQWKQLEVER